jgi:hypothetical protein
MLTVAEFNAAADRHLWRVMRWFGLPLFVLMLGIGVTIHWVVDPVPWLRAHVHPGFPAALVDPLAVIAVIFPFCLVAVWPIHALAWRDRRLVCPHCRRGLYRSYRRVIATRKCPRCSREILTDPDRRRRPKLTREEVDAGAARCRRIGYGFFLGLLLAFPIAIGLIAGANYLMKSALISKTLANCALVAGLLVFVAGMVWACIQGFRLLETFIWCPRCGERNEFGAVKKFGGCCHCSQPLIRSQRAVGAAGGLPGG